MSAQILSNIFDFLDPGILQHHIVQTGFWNLSNILVHNLVCPKLNTLCFGNHGHVQKSDNHEHDDFSGFPKVKSKSHLSEMKQNNYMEGSGHSFFNIYNTNTSPDPPDPTSDMFTGFERNPFFLCSWVMYFLFCTN